MASNQTIIASARYFAVKVPNLPHIPRHDGGHIFVESSLGRSERMEFDENEAIECAWLTMLAGQAFWEVMTEHGIALYRLNYQDNGNWTYIRDGKDGRPLFHIHIYGRAENEVYQSYGQALMLPYSGCGFYDRFDAISDEDVHAIAKRMGELATSGKYQWGTIDVEKSELDCTPRFREAGEG